MKQAASSRPLEASRNKLDRFRAYNLGSEDYEDPETIEGSASLGLDFWTTIVKANYRF